MNDIKFENDGQAQYLLTNMEKAVIWDAALCSLAECI
jgi:hypothetical protein